MVAIYDIHESYSARHVHQERRNDYAFISVAYRIIKILDLILPQRSLDPMQPLAC